MMEDAAFEARSAARRTNRGRIQVVGFALLGLLGAFIALTWLVRLAATGTREVARASAIAALDYPPLPTSPGRYAVQARGRDKIHITTPFIPLEKKSIERHEQDNLWQFQFSDAFEGTKRDNPPAVVTLTMFGPPGTWHQLSDGVWQARSETRPSLFLGGNNGALRAKAIVTEYGEGWDLRAQDRLDFHVPIEFFVPFSTAPNFVGLDFAEFTLSEDARTAIRDFASCLRPGIEFSPPE